MRTLGVGLSTGSPRGPAGGQHRTHILSLSTRTGRGHALVRGSCIRALALAVAMTVCQGRADAQNAINGGGSGAAGVQTVPLAGNHPVFERSLVRGGLDPSATLTLSVVFGLRNRPGLETLQAEQQDPTSSNFRQWLTPEEFNVRFGPDPADVEAVSDWLVQQGFAIVESNQNARYVRFRGSVAQVQSVFRTSVVSVGDALFANNDDPHIPARFDGVFALLDGMIFVLG